MDKISTLWHGASYQDNLLQSYRSYHLTTQSILLAIGVGLTIAVLTFESIYKVLIAYFLLAILSGLAIFLLSKMRKLIRARAEDVDYFHNQIIEFEKAIPKSDRVLTAFKVYQKFNRQQTNINDYFSNFELTESVINELTEKGKGHTRRVLDTNLFMWFFLVWFSFHCVALGIIFLTILYCQ